ASILERALHFSLIVQVLSCSRSMWLGIANRYRLHRRITLHRCLALASASRVAGGLRPRELSRARDQGTDYRGCVGWGFRRRRAQETRKKAEMTAVAEELAQGTGWLPFLLRAKAKAPAFNR